MHKRDLFAQIALSDHCNFVSPITTKGGGYYIELFLDMILPLGVEVQNEKEYLAFYTAILLVMSKSCHFT